MHDTVGEARSPGSGLIGWTVAAAAFALALASATLVDARLATDASHAPRALMLVSQFVTTFGTSNYMFAYSVATAAVAVVVLGRTRDPSRERFLRRVVEGSAFVFSAVAASGVAAQVLKHLLGRARPALLSSDGAFSFHPLSSTDVLASFPSGHTTSAFAAAVAIGLLSPRWRWWMLGFAALVGASRVVVGAHDPSDVVGGAGLGSFTAVALAWLVSRRGWAPGADARRLFAGPIGAAPRDVESWMKAEAK